MSTSNIREKVKKLLAMAGDAGATDNEREVAMRKASALIEEHNIEMGELNQSPDEIEITQGDNFFAGKEVPFHRIAINAAAILFECEVLLHGASKKYRSYSFWGLKHQVEAAEETASWIIAQIEDLYRAHLKTYKGSLDRRERAELRATFKEAAARRVKSRVWEIVAERQEKRDSRALVVVSNVAARIADEFNKKGFGTANALKPKVGFGTGAGAAAGDLVKINNTRQVENNT